MLQDARRKGLTYPLYQWPCLWPMSQVGLDTILDEEKWKFIVRKTKIICTAGPACWSEEGLGKLLDAGCNIVRLNFSHGDHEGHFSVLQRWRKVCAEKDSHAACLLDTKGPEIRTAMLKDGKDIELVANQKVRTGSQRGSLGQQRRQRP